MTQRLRSELTGLNVTKPDPSRLGDIAEAWVSLLATWKGAEVYRNQHCTGKVDLILCIDGVHYPIDVKLARPDNKGSWFGNTSRVKEGVIPVLVIPTGDITEWRVKWIRKRFPQELKNFWCKADHPLTYRENQKATNKVETTSASNRC